MNPPRGAYPATRAAALSGVPLSIVRRWARDDVLVPSTSAHRLMLWSYSDLLGLRIIYWLRRWKTTAEGPLVPRPTMSDVRRALGGVAELDLRLSSDGLVPAVTVDRGGKVSMVGAPANGEKPDPNSALPAADELLRVIEPFTTREGSRGPDLSAPRPRLRIVPGKVGGSPCVAHTRVESQAIAALADSGLERAKIHQLYPQLEPDALEDAISLERQLANNLRVAGSS
ncbi:MAG: DUF433 domain-containing protein [Solirubrobacteraceae bacterium]